LTLTLFKTRLLKAGGYGRATPYQPSPYSLAGFLRPIDLRLLRQLDWGAALYHAESALAWGRALLPDLLGTGRCFWQDLDGAPLTQGPPRTGRFEWASDADGRQQLQLIPEGDDCLALPTAPPWYLDPDSSQAGPIDTGFPEQIAAILATAPSLPAQSAEEASIRLSALPLGKPLPLPASLERVERSDITPTPHLRLTVADQHDVALLDFAYDDHSVPANSGPASLSVRHEGTLLIIHRDPDAEADAVEQLLQLGFEADVNTFRLPDEQAWIDFVRQQLALLEQAGWQIEFDPGFRFHLAEAGDWYAELDEAGHDWFRLDLGVTVDGERVQLLPLLCDAIRRLPQQMDAARLADEPDEREVALRLDDGRLLPLPMSRVRPILTTLLELYESEPLTDGNLSLNRLQSAQLAELSAQTPLHWAGSDELLALGKRLRDFKGIATVTPPAGLQAELRPYQLDGLGWLQFLREFGFSGVLADDMGLGKTLQTLAHLLLDKESGHADRPSLVVCPTSLLANWRREAARFAPTLRVLTLHGPKRQEQLELIPEHDLILTTYALLPRDLEILKDQDFHLLILDEAQYIKNPRAKTAEAARMLNARQRLALTGTPLENHLGELWSLFHFLMPGLLGDQARFNRLFRTPIERQADPVRREQLQQRIAPFLLRRTKAAVATELPPKIESLRSVSLEGAQRDLYETVRVAMDKRVRAEVAAKGWARSQIIVLDALLKLRQICCDPRLVKLSGTRAVTRSAKLELLLDMLPSLIDEGRRILLFSQFTSMLALIEDALRPLGIPYVKLTGSTRDRATPVERFQAGEVPLFLISLKAGGTGLNLTAADTVIHYDPWWNPAVERQATDRAHRIGQTQSVLVYKLIAEGTVEEKMAELQERKQALADAMLDSGAAAGPSLSAEDLQALFAPLA
jgi:superfamily II DNA or RNA helicase